MPHPRQPVDAVASLLEPGEDVWAVFPAGRPALVATSRRIFLVGGTGVAAHRLRDLSAVERADDGLVVVLRPGHPMLRVRVDPADEAGLQALTVLGLLVAAARRAGDAGAAEAITGGTGRATPGDAALPGP